MYNGSNDSFNFKPHELTFIIPDRIMMASLGNSIIKRAKKIVPTKLSGREIYF
jgi:hypothetical protein